MPFATAAASAMPVLGSFGPASDFASCQCTAGLSLFRQVACKSHRRRVIMLSVLWDKHSSYKLCSALITG